LDRFSFVYVALSWMAALAALALYSFSSRLSNWKPRLLAGLAAALIAPIPIILLAPALLGGPIGGLDPEVQRLWVDAVKEFRPLLPFSEGSLSSGYVFLLGPSWLALAYAVNGLRKQASPHWNMCLVGAIGGAIFIAATMEHVRAFSFAQVMAIPSWTLLALAGLRLAPAGWNMAARAAWRSLAFSLAVMGPFLLAGLMLKIEGPKPKAANVDPCRWDLLGRHIAAMRMAPENTIIMTYVFSGPELSYFSGYRAVGTPYHRNAAGIIDTIYALDDRSGRKLQEVAAKRGLGLLALCAASPEQTNGRLSFAARLLAGEGPDWLEPLTLPAPLAADMALLRLR
jgi:hypothetical protein